MGFDWERLVLSQAEYLFIYLFILLNIWIKYENNLLFASVIAQAFLRYLKEGGRLSLLAVHILESPFFMSSRSIN